MSNMHRNQSGSHIIGDSECVKSQDFVVCPAASWCANCRNGLEVSSLVSTIVSWMHYNAQVHCQQAEEINQETSSFRNANKYASHILSLVCKWLEH